MAAPERLSRPLSRLRGRYGASALPGLLSWWRGELEALLPARLRTLLRRGRGRVWIRPLGDAVEVCIDGGPGARDCIAVPAGEFAAAADPLEAALAQGARSRWLALPAARVLRRRMTLPLAAAERLHDVLRFELDRQTPFRAEQVVFDHRLLRRDAEARQIEVELVVLPQDALEAALAALGPLADTLDGVDVEDPARPGATLGLNLLPPERRIARRDGARMLRLALATVAVAACGFALWQTLDNRLAVADELRAEVAERRREAQAVQALRMRLDDASGGASFLAERRATRPGMVALLDELTRRIPDGTSLERLTVSADRVSMIGLSDQASALVAALQDSPLLVAPALSGSVQADARSGRERFTLTAGLATPAAAAPKEAADAAR
ncbi:PilN domain-containing protein [Coralloluteibacterium stylophorae]|uniref:PilN domain-containing protein n=1 Tax=Coralloluteibacterium stylophorae TaxID=1776034 RepID=A0A8J7VS78_9GAMM|nr:PilN domain-containing protein [Coralloluteibacterium stylophorae]MBS7457775.1 PilN domain-containing protein [Coralloluteibacterium stylophorae]